MKISPDITFLPKQGHSREEYEDAFAIADETWPRRFAVADGATESAYSRVWANMLVKGYVDVGPDADEIASWMDERRAAWRTFVKAQEQDMPWYSAAKVHEGAHATLLGCTFEADGFWEALSIGDCCLFQLRDSELITTWPFTDADAFTNMPPLLSSQESDKPADVQWMSGSWEAGDRFLLATDAVASFLLSDGRAKRFARPEVNREALIATARAQGAIRNDDCTLLVLTAEAGS